MNIFLLTTNMSTLTNNLQTISINRIKSRHRCTVIILSNYLSILSGSASRFFKKDGFDFSLAGEVV